MKKFGLIYLAYSHNIEVIEVLEPSMLVKTHKYGNGLTHSLAERAFFNPQNLASMHVLQIKKARAL